MLEDIRNSMAYFRETLKSEIDLPESHRRFSNIIICGMGGSAISGDVVKDAFKDLLRFPVEISRTYRLPGYASGDSLVVCLSYSGNTWETLAQLNQAIEKNCKIVCVSSNGKMETIARERNLPYVKLSGGMMPRVAFPYLLSALLAVFQNLGLVSVPELGLEKNLDKIENEAKRLTERVNNTFPIIISQYPSVVLRYKTQLNENSKFLAKDEILPEIHHNEVESWVKLDEKFSVILLRENGEDKEVSNSFDIDKKLLDGKNVCEVFAEGDTRLERILYLILLGDFLSYFLAEKNNTDPYPVNVIAQIKEYLATHS
ncbi:MAG: bifunctional phosphoglucose/phosphomannose isomerase [Candidatus Aenigmarchaeota archaeon]|nr:bifunctional phosphoglucose/phosphomannose isomerase [Candidatus Aenigmarchaeota archaeon]